MAHQMHDLPSRHHSGGSRSDMLSSRLSDTSTNDHSESSASDTRPSRGRDTAGGERRSSAFFRSPFNSARRPGGDENGARGLRLLFASPEPLVDLIFVHGLRGGSIKTWRKGADPRLFWPQQWLPMEPELYNASIHSFGYESDWGSTKPSILNVHDFGRALYEEMRSSPLLRQSSSPIILVGHSMGGLVVKKAYILAHQDTTRREMSQRIRCIFFLATPHRGSDYAATLNSILKVVGVSGMISSREYINDLTAGSTSTQLINEEFGKHAHNLLIYSFYETLPTTLGVSSTIIVDKNSAILGIGEHERVHYLHANHRDICKFETPEDSNYLSLKNALASTVQDLLRNEFIANEQKSHTQLRTIHTFLGSPNSSDEHLEILTGSCHWIEDREDFRQWRDSYSDFDQAQNHNPCIYWVTANPGAGKTVLATHIVAQLQQFRLQHASYFFHFGKKSSQSLAGFLRSVAYEMAGYNAAVREAIMKLYDGGSTFDQDDTRAIWSKVFRAGIFQVPLFTAQYWIIDAIDECPKYNELFSLLKDTQSQFPLKIFVTSRKLPELPRIQRQLQSCSINVVEIPLSDTMNDIKLFVKSRMDLLPIDNDDEKDELSKDILARSGASFLWVKLVMDELEGVYGYESILQVLRGIPEGMISYYARTVTEMAENKREKHIAKAILRWVVLAARPLSTVELSKALELDINVRLPSAKVAIEGLCGQLVSVDQANFVHIVHSTAQEFLLSEDAREFTIPKSNAHERMALVCLRLLTSPEMQPPRNRRLLGQKRPKFSTSALLDYALMHFSDHVLSASSESDNLLATLDRFLSTTVLSWIQKVVTKKDLHCLIRTARNLKAYLDRRLKYHSPLSRHVRNVDSWATDLSRLATGFGGALTSNPQSIYFLVPPLCPTESAIYQSFGRSSDGLALLGLNNLQWDDCVATIHFQDERAGAIACGNNLIAIGFESGNIHLYNQRSCQKDQVIKGERWVDLIRFDPLGSFVVACGGKFVTVWDLSGNLLWKTRLRSRCILLSSSSTYILGVTQQGRAFYWDIATGEVLEEHVYTYQSPDSDAEPVNKAPSTASISPGLELLALAYRNGPICIFEMQSDRLIGWAAGDQSRAPEQLIFNPNPDVGLLLVAYNESHLALYDSWSGDHVHSLEPERNVIFTSISCSPDGRTIGMVDILGSLRILDFESLTILYHVLTPTQSFRLLDFTSDGFNLVDVDDCEMRIWSPAALVRKTVEEEASTSDQAAVCLFQWANLRWNYNGDVVAYSSVDGKRTGALYSHKAVVKCLAATEKNTVASGDLNCDVQVWQMVASLSPQAIVTAETLKFQVHLRSPICQLLFDQSGNYLLVSTVNSDHVYETASGILVGSVHFSTGERSVWRWTTLSGEEHGRQFVLLLDNKLAIYSAEEFPTKSHGGDIKLDYNVDDGFVEIGIDSVLVHPETMSLIVDVRQQAGFVTRSSIAVFQLPKPMPGTSVTMALQPVQALSTKHCMHFLGISRTEARLFFLHQDSWVSSVDIATTGNSQKEYLQHFFVPNEFITNSASVLPLQTAQDDFVFCLHDKLAIIKNGLKFQEPRLLT